MKRRRVGGGGDSDDGVVVGGDGGDVRVRSAEGEEVAWPSNRSECVHGLHLWGLRESGTCVPVGLGNSPRAIHSFSFCGRCASEGKAVSVDVTQ